MSLLRVERHGVVVVLAMDDTENRFNLDSLSEWHATLDDIEATEGALAVVVTGTGKFFSNGLDLDRMGADPDQAGPTVSGVHRLLGRMSLLPAYTVAAINGHAFAGGAMLAATCDVRVMRTGRGFWCLPEVDLGLPLTDCMLGIVTARLPRAAAHDAIITGRRYTAEDAASLGIVDEALPEDLVLDRAVELAAAMAPKDRSVIAAHKQMLFGEVANRCGWPA